MWFHPRAGQRWVEMHTVGMTFLTSPTGGGFKPKGGSPFDLINRSRAIHCSLLQSVSPQRPFGEVFEIELDTLETTCHALDPTPAANCSVRRLEEHVSGPLRVILDSGPTSSTMVLYRSGLFIYPAAQPALMVSQCAVSKISI